MKKNTVTKLISILFVGLSLMVGALPAAQASMPNNSNYSTKAIALGTLGVLGAVGAGFAIFGNNSSSSNPAPAPVPAPNITSISPAVGPLGGNTTVTINGTGFTGTTAVTFGNNNATLFTVDSATQITAVSPAGAAGIVDITMTTPNGTSTAKFTYTAGPTIASLSKIAGPLAGGTSIIITGTGFTGATSVKFGQTDIAFRVTDDEHISITSPNLGSQTRAQANVTVVTPYGTSNAAVFTYQPAPYIMSLSPTQGSGGTELIISGSYFSAINGDIFVRFEALQELVKATNVTSNSLHVIVPADLATDTNVFVVNGDEQESNSQPFTYQEL